jgi:hypothetical protein
MSANMSRILLKVRRARPPRQDFATRRRAEMWPRLVGTRLAVIRSDPKQNQAAMEEGTMRGILLWLIGIPIPINILLWLFGVLH